MSLKNKVAIVTGGNSGIGQAIVPELARQDLIGLPLSTIFAGGSIVAVPLAVMAALVIRRPPGLAGMHQSTGF